MSTVQNIIRAGQESANDSAQLYRDVRENSVRYDNLQIQNMRARADLQTAAWKADAKVKEAKIDKDTTLKKEEIELNTQKKEAKAKKQQRFAGKLAAAGGKLAGYHYLKNKKDTPNTYLQAHNEYIAKLQAKVDNYSPQGQSAVENELRAQLEKSKNTVIPEVQRPSYGKQTGSGTNGGAVSTTLPEGSNLSMQYMQKLTSNGMSKEQAAATVGHLLVETGGFKHMEELAPNSHGTKGYGHLQWTDPTPGKGRRTDYMNYTKQHGLDPKSFEGNSDFLVHELTTNFNKSWTNGGSFEGLQQQGTLEGASQYLQSNYIRPGVPHTERRLAEGRNVLKQWDALQQQ